MLVMNSIFSVLYSNIWKCRKRRRPIFRRAGSIRNKGWLDEAPEDTNAKCKLCKKVFKLSNMVADALKSHADSKRHKLDQNTWQNLLRQKSNLQRTIKPFWPMYHLYRNQSIDWRCELIDWFLYEGNTGLKWFNWWCS